MEIVYHIVAIVLLALGIVGCVAPFLPGPILAYAAFFCLIPTANCPSVSTFVLLGLITLIVTIADSIIPALGAKKFNCSRWGTWGCLVGTIVGFFFFPIGLIAGSFLGAFLGELIAGKNSGAAFRGGMGAFLGFLAGTLLKLALCISFAIYIVSRLF